MQVWNYGNPEQLLLAIADAFSFLGSIAILAERRARPFSAASMRNCCARAAGAKQRIREFVVAKSGRTMADLKRTGRLDGAIVDGDETTLHYALDDAGRPDADLRRQPDRLRCRW